MNETTAPTRGIQLVRHEEERALVARGAFIPLSLQPKRRAQSLMVRRDRSPMITLLAVLMTIFGVGAVYAPLWTDYLSQPTFLTAAVARFSELPELRIKDPVSGHAVAPAYGASLQYANRAHYEGVQAALIVAGASFIDLDLPRARVRQFTRGVLTTDATIARVPASDSWCAVLPGLYEVASVVPEHYSLYVDVYLPQSVIFGGNRFIHGWPHDANRQAVSADFDRDCVRLETKVATALAAAAEVGMPVLVHGTAPTPEPAPEFESKVPNFPTPYYLIADASSDTILAVGDKHASVPIASITKLMTALVVLETMPLDTPIPIVEPSLIETVVPRLSAGGQVSVYALLELLLLESSNEAAEVLAGEVGREAFIARMNERALALGLFDTVFTDPAGVESTNVSSVHDLWWLIRYLKQYYPFIIELTRDTATTPAGVTDAFDELTNFNLVETDDTFIGGKIGETKAAGQTSVTIHRLSFGGTTRDVVIVLLGSNGRTADVEALLSYLTDRFGE
jgi:D-alanyl-D-alanine endopeptidase (penicillin-binding protein 7)